MKEMEFYGICVPEKDASWELEENAYQDLLYRPECGADDCHCADGRKYNGESAWVLLPCCNCGADARHQSCADLEAGETTWTCNECKILEDLILKKRMIPQVATEVTEGANHIDSVSQQVPTSEMQTVDSEPSCSNICSNGIPSPIAETENFHLDNVTSLSTSAGEDDELIPCEDVPLAVMSPCEVPPISKNTVESKVKESANCKSLKREIPPPEPNLNDKKMCFMDDILNQMKSEKMQNKPAFILNCNSIKINTSTRQSKVILKKRKADKKFNSGCCSGNPQQCIKKMFGLQCHNYRI
ncbi:G2/M phase-specific E3 ubiquitin-protein ligase [Araneus ventricosus]|uniref:G2/M phase-specific E3 ubiquitin-protein ligase n=1 Tax=Araneus ventricosus TaxID=182803 RepID=A0A4Y2BG13_ARAVE|nr:G2/M phase-specific E3 ubiquitin-protein ligase [Araneus ventricosus]